MGYYDWGMNETLAEAIIGLFILTTVLAVVGIINDRGHPPNWLLDAVLAVVMSITYVAALALFCAWLILGLLT